MVAGRESSLPCFMGVGCVCVSGSISTAQIWGPLSLEKSSNGPTFAGTSDQPDLPGPSCLSFLRASLS